MKMGDFMEYVIGTAIVGTLIISRHVIRRNVFVKIYGNQERFETGQHHR